MGGELVWGRLGRGREDDLFYTCNPPPLPKCLKNRNKGQQYLEKDYI